MLISWFVSTSLKDVDITQQIVVIYLQPLARCKLEPRFNCKNRWCVCIIVHICRTWHSTEQFWWSSLLSSKQSFLLISCLLVERGLVGEGCRWKYRWCVATADVGRRRLAELNVGQVVNARVTSVTDDGVLCSLSHGVRALVTTDHMPGIYWYLGNGDLHCTRITRSRGMCAVCSWTMHFTVRSLKNLFKSVNLWVCNKL